MAAEILIWICELPVQSRFNEAAANGRGNPDRRRLRPRPDRPLQ